MKYFGTIIYGIIEIITLFAIFNYSVSLTESLIITILIIIYITVRSIGIGLTQMFTLTVSGFYNELGKLKSLIGHPDMNQVESDEEMGKVVSKNQTKFYIQSTTIFILFVITIFKLMNILIQ